MTIVTCVVCSSMICWSIGNKEFWATNWGGLQIRSIVTIDVILMLAKLLLTDVMPALPGLDDQQPESSLISLLKTSPDVHDAGIQADYSPPSGLQAIMRSADQAMDFVFGQKQNDLVVPTLGVSHWPGGVFAPDRLLPFASERSVYHCNLFLQPETRRHLLACLDA